MILTRYVPPVNKKEVQGFLKKVELDGYYDDPTEGARIEYLELRREGDMMPANLWGWLERQEDEKGAMSLTLRYTNDAYLIVVYRWGKEPEKIYYGPGEGLKRVVEFRGVYPESERTRYV